MKKFILTMFVLLLLASVSAAQTKATVEKSTFDSDLATKLGADEYGMRSYFFVILKTGPNDSKVKGEERDAAFKGHFSNMGRLADEGKLVVAGPFMQNDQSYRGLFIFNVKTVEEAQKLVETDPAVKAGIFVAELTQWYGSASLMATPEIHKKIAQKNP